MRNGQINGGTVNSPLKLVYFVKYSYMEAVLPAGGFDFRNGATFE